MNGAGGLQDTVLTLGGFIFVCGVIWSIFKVRDWLDARIKAETDEAARDAAEAMESARLAHEKVAMLQAAMNAHQLMQAERLVSREVLREVEGRLASSIKGLGERFDILLKELIEMINKRQPGG